MKSSVVDDDDQASESTVSWDYFDKAKHGISSGLGCAVLIILSV